VTSQGDVPKGNKKMKEGIRREETRELDSLIDRLERSLSAVSSDRQRKIQNPKNVAGNNVSHLPTMTSSSIVDSIFWKKDSGS